MIGFKRLSVCACVLLLLCVLVPARAFAADAPTVKESYDGDFRKIFVWDITSGVVDTNYDAACWAMGKDPSTLTDLMKAYLADDRYCPEFTDFASKFTHGWGSTDGGVVPISLQGYYTLNMGDIWISESMTNGDYDSARREFVEIINERWPSGGGSDTSSSLITYYGSRDYSRYEFSGYCFSPVRAKSSGLPLMPSSVAVSVNSAWFANAPVSLADYEIVYFMQGNGGNFELYLVPKGGYEVTSSTFVDDGVAYATNLRFTCSSGAYKMLGWTTGSVNSNANVIGPSNYTFNGSSITWTGFTDATRFKWQAWNGLSKNFEYGWSSVGAVSSPGPPSGNWPSGGDGGGDSPTPTPPTVPGPVDPGPRLPPVPGNPIIPDPPVTDPPVTDPVVVINPPSNTSPTDYTPWLRAILDALNGLWEDIETHCVHLQRRMQIVGEYLYNGLTAYFSGLYTQLSAFLGQLASYAVGEMMTCFGDLSEYLQALFEWLAEQFDFSFGGGGDGPVTLDSEGIIAWLKLIYSKMGGSSTKPDVGLNPLGFFEWLSSILAGILGGLVALTLGVVGTMGDALGSLSAKFPFSLPWDLAAMLALFVHEPVTPVVDIPFAAVSGANYVHVDLSILDGTFSVVRAIELVGFGAGLARRTPDLLALADTI